MRSCVSAWIRFTITMSRWQIVFAPACSWRPSTSAIVSLPWEGAAKQLAAAGIRATEWRGNLRLAFHVYNDEADVDSALAVLRSLERPAE